MYLYLINNSKLLTILYAFRAFKISFKDLIGTPAWESLSSYWKSEILTDIEPVWAGEPRILRGVLQDPKQFIPKYLLRFMMRMERDGVNMEPGTYTILLKGGSDGGRHNWFRWMKGKPAQHVPETFSI